MRVIVACTVVVLSILAAIALARTNVLAPLTPSSASAPAERVSAPAPAKLAVVRPPANPIQTRPERSACENLVGAAQVHATALQEKRIIISVAKLNCGE